MKYRKQRIWEENIQIKFKKQMRTENINRIIIIIFVLLLKKYNNG